MLRKCVLCFPPSVYKYTIILFTVAVFLHLPSYKNKSIVTDIRIRQIAECCGSLRSVCSAMSFIDATTPIVALYELGKRAVILHNKYGFEICLSIYVHRIYCP